MECVWLRCCNKFTAGISMVLKALIWEGAYMGGHLHGRALIWESLQQEEVCTRGPVRYDSERMHSRWF